MTIREQNEDAIAISALLAETSKQLEVFINSKSIIDTKTTSLPNFDAAAGDELYSKGFHYNKNWNCSEKIASIIDKACDTDLQLVVF